MQARKRYLTSTNYPADATTIPSYDFLRMMRLRPPRHAPAMPPRLFEQVALAYLGEIGSLRFSDSLGRYFGQGRRFI